jgi:far upstream element-binding protein
MSDTDSKSPTEGVNNDNEKSETLENEKDLKTSEVDNEKDNEITVDNKEKEKEKRKRDEDEDDKTESSDVKKVKDQPTVAPAINYEEIYGISMQSVISGAYETSEKIEVAPDKVGHIIGSKGLIIQDIQAKSGCKILIKQEGIPPHANREVTFTGTREQVNNARKLVDLVLQQGPTAVHMLNGPIITDEMDCPQPLVGRVIGSGGSTIKEIQGKCGAKIQINQDFPEGVPRKVMITGNPHAVEIAKQLVRNIMETGSISGASAPGAMGGMGMMMPMMAMQQMQQPMFAGYSDPTGMGLGIGNAQLPINPASTPTCTILECAKALVGRLIGRGGETINLIQSRSGARVQIEQNVPEGVPCKVNITGQPQAVAIAAACVQEISMYGPNKVQMLPLAGGGVVYPSPAANNYYGAPAMNYGMPQANPYAQPNYGHAMPAAAVAYNPYAGQQQNAWSQPQAVQQAQHMMAPAAGTKPLPQGWSEHKTDEGHLYWYNSATGVSQVKYIY